MTGADLDSVAMDPRATVEMMLRADLRGRTAYGAPQLDVPVALNTNENSYAVPDVVVDAMTKAVAADFVERGIRCNAICPGTIESPSLEQRIADQARTRHVSTDEVRQAFVARQPIGRIGRAEEVAALALYLASDEASFTTGAIHLIDGGWSN